MSQYNYCVFQNFCESLKQTHTPSSPLFPADFWSGSLWFWWTRGHWRCVFCGPGMRLTEDVFLRRSALWIHNLGWSDVVSPQWTHQRNCWTQNWPHSGDAYGWGKFHQGRRIWCCVMQKGGVWAFPALWAVQASTWWPALQLTSFLPVKPQSSSPLFTLEMPRQSASISGITWEERLLVRHHNVQTHHQRWYKNTHLTTENFCRLSDFVFDVPERREGTDLFKRSEPRRHVAPRQWEHLQRSAGLAGRDAFIAFLWLLRA